MEMSASGLPTESELIVKGRKAAYCARRRLGQSSDLLTGQDLEDLIQVATLAYWKHHQNGRPIPYCFVCARQAAEKYFYRNIMGRNPRSPFSLDAPLHDGGDLPHEWLAPPAPATNDTLRLDWLSDEILEGVLLEARAVAGFSQYQLTRYWDTIQTDKRIVRLAANGHTNASIAELMGTTEGTIRNRRQRIRRLLERLLPVHACVEYSRTGGNQQRACEIQSAYPGRRKPETA
jgi:DNA-binding CsgD family transcriptional regulator